MPETSRDAAILQGDLSRIQLPDVLSFIAMIRATGKLALRNGALDRTIIWKDGEIVFANSNSPEHSLGGVRVGEDDFAVLPDDRAVERAVAEGELAGGPDHGDEAQDIR